MTFFTAGFKISLESPNHNDSGAEIQAQNVIQLLKPHLEVARCTV